MRFPPVYIDELVALGMAADAVQSWDGVAATITPQPPVLVTKLLAAAMASPPPMDNRMAYLRHVRDLVIGLTDWTQATDAPLTQSQRSAWASYRQALRDLPGHYSGSGPIGWPAVPQ